MRLTVLGTGTIAFSPTRSCSGYYVEAGTARLLVDCGAGITRRLAELAIPWHEVSHVAPAAAVCDILQVPAFLSRQTDLLVAVGKSGRVANLKKGQFLSPWEMGNAAEKVAGTGNEKIILTERGSSFGYHNLVVDMRSFPVMRKLGYPVVFDVTHSVQLPGGEGKSSGGQPEFIEPLARAGTATGVDGIFLEVHDNPAKALSDGTNALPLNQFRPLLEKIKQLSALVREWESPRKS